MQYLRPELHRKSYEVRRKNTVTTKLDAPYTLLSIQGQALRVPVGSEVKGEDLRALNVDLQNLMPPEPLLDIGALKSAAALVQTLSKSHNQEQEAQQSIGPGYLQADRALANVQENVVKEGGMLTQKERRAEKLIASKVQSNIAKKRNEKVAEEAKVIADQYPCIPEKVIRNKARKAVASNIKQGLYKLHGFAYTSAVEAVSEQSMDGEACIIRPNSRKRGKRDDDHTSAIRFTSQEQKSHGKAALQSEAEGPQDAPPMTIRRHLSVGSGHLYQTNRALSKQKLNDEIERDSVAHPDDIKNDESLDSVPILRVGSEGRDPSTAYKGKDGKLFVLKKHFTMNPFERLQAIQQVGEITSREQATGLHGQYHLALESQLGEARKS